jgi:hypothetical protein
VPRLSPTPDYSSTAVASITFASKPSREQDRLEAVVLDHLLICAAIQPPPVVRSLDVPASCPDQVDAGNRASRSFMAAQSRDATRIQRVAARDQPLAA